MLVILDNGHGGLIKGGPQTAQRRSPIFSDGKQLFEGELNRAIVNGIIQELTFMQIPYLNICTEISDISKTERVNRANANNETNCFLVSVHSNYYKDPAVDGSEFWCFKGSALGAEIATIFAQEYQAEFPNEKLRKELPSRLYKENNTWAVLKRTNMPAVLTENFFFSNIRETREILLTREGRNRIVDFHVSAIVRVFVEVFGIDTWGGQ